MIPTQDSEIKHFKVLVIIMNDDTYYVNQSNFLPSLNLSNLSDRSQAVSFFCWALVYQQIPRYLPLGLTTY